MKFAPYKKIFDNTGWKMFRLTVNSAAGVWTAGSGYELASDDLQLSGPGIGAYLVKFCRRRHLC